MTSHRTTALSRLRGRLWRLAALLLWLAVFTVNLAAAFDKTAQASTLAGDLQASLCHSGGDGTGPAAASDRSDDQAGATHCAFCHIFAAGILTTPGHDQVAVLRPDGERGMPLAAMAAPPAAATPTTQARPRAPPASV